MDFDALVNLKRVLMSDNVTDTDIMLLKSAINNGSVDINISISENLDSIFSSNIDNSEFMVYLEEFINCDEYYLNTPIYKLFLFGHKSFFPLLNIALFNKRLKDTTFYDIINQLFKDLSTSTEEDYSFILVLIQDMISTKGKVSYESITSQDEIMDFIILNIYSLFNKEVIFNDVISKELILKLFSYGYIHFSDFISFENGSLFLKMFVHAIFDMGDYSYLLSLLNDKMLDFESCTCIKEVVLEYISDITSNYRMCELILEKIETIEKSLKEQGRKPLM